MRKKPVARDSDQPQFSDDEGDSDDSGPGPSVQVGRAPIDSDASDDSDRGRGCGVGTVGGRGSGPDRRPITHRFAARADSDASGRDSPPTRTPITRSTAAAVDSDDTGNGEEDADADGDGDADGADTGSRWSGARGASWMRASGSGGRGSHRNGNGRGGKDEEEGEEDEETAGPSRRQRPVDDDSDADSPDNHHHRGRVEDEEPGYSYGDGDSNNDHGDDSVHQHWVQHGSRRGSEVGTGGSGPVSSRRRRASVIVFSRSRGDGEDRGADEGSDAGGNQWSPEDLPPLPQVSGWLWKKGGGTTWLFGRRNWKRRWFVLEGVVLSYCKSQAAWPRKVLGVIDLPSARVCTVLGGKYPNSFDVRMHTCAWHAFFFVCLDVATPVARWFRAASARACLGA